MAGNEQNATNTELGNAEEGQNEEADENEEESDAETAEGDNTDSNESSEGEEEVEELNGDGDDAGDSADGPGFHLGDGVNGMAIPEGEEDTGVEDSDTGMGEAERGEAPAEHLEAIVFPERPARGPKHWAAWVQQRLPLPGEYGSAPRYTATPGLSAEGKARLMRKLNRDGEEWDDEAKRAVTEVDVWELFITESMQEDMVQEIKNFSHFLRAKPRPDNIPAHRPWPPAFLKDFEEPTVEELRTYLGIQYAIGMHKCPSVKKFFSTKPRASYTRPAVCDYMARNRFQALRSCFHLRNEMEELEEGELKKIGKFLDTFERQCLAIYVAGEYLALDEMMIRFEGNFALGPELDR